MNVGRDGKGLGLFRWSEQERDEAMKKVSSRANVYVQRFKGLGEMNAEQLADTTMDISRRTLLRVTMEDAVKAEEMFSMPWATACSPAESSSRPTPARRATSTCSGATTDHRPPTTWRDSPSAKDRAFR